jgi:hypothetical protein
MSKFPFRIVGMPFSLLQQGELLCDDENFSGSEIRHSCSLPVFIIKNLFTFASAGTLGWIPAAERGGVGC